MKTIKNLKAEEIRKSILQLAIQGKLVKQDPNDEPASELVKRIYEEKNRLIKEGKIKKDKNESYIFKGDDNCYYEKVDKNGSVKLDDLPFDIPDSWEWIRLKNCVQIQTGKKDANFGGETGRYDFFTCALIPIKADSFSYSGEYIILPGNGANVGQSIHYFGEFEAYQRTYLINKIYNKFNFFYLKIVLDAIWKKWNEDKLFGSAIPYIKLPNLEEFLVPLPPINEQQRIVDRLNLIEPLINEYDSFEKKLTKLEEEFPEKLKKSILQYAIEGKLVKQDPNDEPASVLLERIKKEKEALIKAGKIKRDKNESTIYQGDDKNYYENLPYNWEEVRLRCICDVRGGKRIPAGEKFSIEKTLHKYIRVGDMKNQTIIGCTYISDQIYEEIKAYYVMHGDLYLTVAGTIGSSGIIPEEYHMANLTENADKLLLNSKISKEWFLFFLQSEVCQKQIREVTTKVGQPKLAIKRIEDLFVLLPPKNEQTRIVFALKNLLNNLSTESF